MPRKIVGVLLAASLFAVAGAGFAARAVGTQGVSTSKASTKAGTVSHHKRNRTKVGPPTSSHVSMTPAQTYAYWTKARMKAATPAPMGVSGGPQPASTSEPGGTGSSAPGAQLGAPSEGP